MEKEFVSYELAVKLKELEFDEECFRVKLKNSPEHWYTQTDYEDYPEQKEEEVLIPLWQQAFDWFREKGFSFNVDKIHNETDLCHFHINYKWEYFQGTYQEARQACLEKLIEIVENEKIQN